MLNLMKWQCVQAQHMLGYCRIETIHYDTEMSTFIICMFTNIRDVGKVCHGFTETQIIVVVFFLNSKLHLFVIYSEQYNIWLYFISYYRKINKSLKTSHIHCTSQKQMKWNLFNCWKRWISNRRLLGELTLGREAISFG